MNQTFYPFKLYLKNLFLGVSTAISFLVNLATWLWLLIYIQPQEETIFLHYNILFGVDFIGEWWRVLYIPLTGTIILLLNTMLGWVFFQRDSLISKLLHIVCVICQLFLFVAAALLVFLNV